MSAVEYGLVSELVDGGIIEKYSNGFPREVGLEERLFARQKGLEILKKVVDYQESLGLTNGKGIINIEKAREAIEEADYMNWDPLSEQIRELSYKEDGNGEESSALRWLSRSMVDD